MIIYLFHKSCEILKMVEATDLKKRKKGNDSLNKKLDSRQVIAKPNNNALLSLCTRYLFHSFKRHDFS